MSAAKNRARNIGREVLGTLTQLKPRRGRGVPVAKHRPESRARNVGREKVGGEISGAGASIGREISVAKIGRERSGAKYPPRKIGRENFGRENSGAKNRARKIGCEKSGAKIGRENSAAKIRPRSWPGHVNGG
jgi:hypothetical protein